MNTPEILLWVIVCASLVCAVVWMVRWACREWKAVDAPHTYDDRLAQREIDIAKAHAEEEAYASRQRRRVRAGRSV